MAASSEGDGQSRFVVAAFAELSFGFLGMILGWFFGPDPQTHVPLLSDVEGISEGIVLGGCMGAILAAAIFALARLPLRSLRDLQEMMETRLREFLIQMTPVELVVLAMAAGFGEEILFRGWLQQGLFSVLGAEKNVLFGVLGLLIASVLFGLAHPISPIYVVLATLMGIALGTIYWSTGNLLCAIVAHAVYDAIILLKWNKEMRTGVTPGNVS
jgi:membrane protease YdiL (CAAX protease family)